MTTKLYANYRTVNSVALLLAVTIATACGQSPTSPVPNPSPSPGGASGIAPAPGSAQAGVALCHRTEGSTEFVPLTVAVAAVDPHLAHGDVRVGDAVPGQPGAIMTAE